jgi:hypothetical protein
LLPLGIEKLELTVALLTTRPFDAETIGAVRVELAKVRLAEAPKAPALLYCTWVVEPAGVPVTVKSPDPNTLLPLMVLMFVPLTSVACLLLKVVQSVLVK